MTFLLKKALSLKAAMLVNVLLLLKGMCLVLISLPKKVNVLEQLNCNYLFSVYRFEALHLNLTGRNKLRLF